MRIVIFYLLFSSLAVCAVDQSDCGADIFKAFQARDNNHINHALRRYEENKVQALLLSGIKYGKEKGNDAGTLYRMMEELNRKKQTWFQRNYKMTIGLYVVSGYSLLVLYSRIRKLKS